MKKKTYWLANRLNTVLSVEVPGGIPGSVNFPREVAGIMYAFSTKKAAREMYGKDVKLYEIQLAGDET